MKAMTGFLSRRQFLRRTVNVTATAAASAGFSAPFLASPGAFGRPVNGLLQHACIGVGGMGAVDLENFRQHERVRIVAICDVDENHLKAAGAKVPEARLYRDWRELLIAESHRIDSVNVTVPDHMHFPIAYTAIARGKHVYCQKPMCHDVAEVRELTEAARRHGVVTQLGTQLASATGDRTTVRWLRDGVIGKIRHVYLSANRPGAVEMYRPLGPRPTQGQAPPAHLDWDRWLGTAPERPFVPEMYHPVKWRGWLDFGTGWSGDIGCHVFDAVWKGLRLGAPKSVTARVQESWQNSPERRADTWPQANHITWTFPGGVRTAGEELTVEWFDGDFWAPPEIRGLFSVDDYPAESAMVIGTEGALLNPLGRSPILLPEEKFKDVKRPKFEDRNHYHHFVDTCFGDARCESHFGQSGPMTEAILLGTIAVRVPGTELAWDARRLRIPNHPEAEAMLRRHYRPGWRVAAPQFAF
jgi:predicted dehydrogenase